MSSSSHRELQQLCRWHPFENATRLAQAAVLEIQYVAKHSIDSRGAFHLVLAGGSTPRVIYEAMCDAQTDWGAWHIYFGDERCVPPGDEERNSRMAALAWLDHVPIPAAQIHIVPAEDGAAAVAGYAGVVEKVDLFDLVLLGLGEDGHTASLFPGHDAGTSSDAAAVLFVADAPKPPPQRISLSARRLSASRQVMFLITGHKKAQALQQWRDGISIPAAAITPAAGVDIYFEVVS
jgi:6-phosphogluconolactonase